VPVEKVTGSWSPPTTQMPRKNISTRAEVCNKYAVLSGIKRFLTVLTYTVILTVNNMQMFSKLIGCWSFHSE